MPKRLQLKITDTAKRRIAKFLKESGFVQALPGLLLSSRTKGQEETWYIGAYTQDQVKDLEQMYASKDFAVVYEADGIELCVPQVHLVALLDGKTLDYQEDHYV